MGLLRFALKTTVAGGLVYFTIQEGLWSKPEESVKIYGKIYNKVAPFVKENVPKGVINEIPDLPSTTDISDVLRNSWNKGVMTSMKFIYELPTHTSNGVNKILEIPAIKEAFGSVKSDSVTNKTQ
ncbi:MICOS complex subunit MIC13 homolog QIL1 isoform X2 [Belonocnema kinseyi]|uniref:MICOS complex subunit MIC13 homolog QIL1 isoform X2 n=1 Tax=Belonocnema kinseyi TaxID=2817044 RepID=UPI00143DF422|nr:MICOS complex subunit MIC13 homolog QIL1 isoform X2 [Belonocnema kinseyi]